MEAVAQIVVDDTTTGSVSFTSLPQTHSSLHIEGMAASTNTGTEIEFYATFNKTYALRTLGYKSHKI